MFKPVGGDTYAEAGDTHPGQLFVEARLCPGFAVFFGDRALR
jgi:hypothetical protein